MSDLAAIITALTGLLIALGGGARWLWNKIEARAVAREADVEERIKAVEAKVAECEQRETAGRAREEAAKERSAAQVTVIELLWREVERLSPEGSKVLKRAHQLLTDLKKDAD